MMPAAPPAPRRTLALLLSLLFVLLLAAGWTVASAMRADALGWLALPVAALFITLHAALHLPRGWRSALGAMACVLLTALLASLGGIWLMTGGSLGLGIAESTQAIGPYLTWDLLKLRVGLGTLAWWVLGAELAAWRRL